MKILACTDGSANSTEAIRWAAQFAKNYKSDLAILHVMRGSSKEQGEIYSFEETKKEGQKILEDTKMFIEKEFPGLKITVHLEGGNAAKAIVELAEKEKVDGMVLGSRGLGEFKRLLLGSVAQKVMVYAPCPVTVVR